MDRSKILAFIAECGDPAQLKSLISNARRQGAKDVEDAAQRRMYRVQAGSQPGTLAFDVWQSIHALEDALSTERGKTIRLSRTRQKITRVGEEQTVIDLVAGSAAASSGYGMLIERGWPELTFEALAVRHDMPEAVQAAATARLANDGVDVPALVAKMKLA